MADCREDENERARRYFSKYALRRPVIRDYGGYVPLPQPADALECNRLEADYQGPQWDMGFMEKWSR